MHAPRPARLPAWGRGRRPGSGACDGRRPSFARHVRKSPLKGLDILPRSANLVQVDEEVRTANAEREAARASGACRLARRVGKCWPWSHRCDEGRPDPGPDRLQLSTAQFHHMVSRKEVGHRYCCGAASAAAVGGTTVFRTRPCDPVAGDRMQRSDPPRSCGGWGSTGRAPVKSVDGVLPLSGPGAVGYAPGPPFVREGFLGR